MVERKVVQLALGQVAMLVALKAEYWGFPLVEKKAFGPAIEKVDSLEWSGVVLTGAKKAHLLVYSTVELLEALKVECWGFHLT